jgi:purine-nucleoside phosphorylase
MVEKMDSSHVPYRIAAAYLLQRVQHSGKKITLPVIGIICGSGLSELSNTLQEPTLTIQYSEIPGFPSHCTVEGHKGEIVFGMLSNVPTMCFRGRFHSYEGYDMKTVVLPVNVMRCLNVQVCIVTNAAGGLNPTYSVGDVVAVSDHLAIPQLAGKNPLIGPNDDELGPRFPATSNAYDERLRQTAQRAANQLGINFFHPHGTYCFVSGPMYESKAECRLLRMLGGDCVGMSTIPEIVAAHHCNMKTLCLSLITNQVIMTGDEGAPVASHAEVLVAVAERSKQMQRLVQQIVTAMKVEFLPTLPPLRQVSLIISDDLKRNYEIDRRKSECQRISSHSRTTFLSGCTLVVIGIGIGLLLRQKNIITM